MRTWIAVVLVFVASSSHADPGDAVALDHLDRGIAAYRLGDYSTAHRELGLAQELAPDHPNPYRWLALTELKQGDCRDALVHIEAFLSRVPVGDPRAPELIAARQQCVHEAQPAPLPVAPEQPPVYHRWWFWTAIGVVAVAAVGVTVAVTHGSDEATLPPIRCSPGGCP
jgi:cytochrome c-type biogenesis protein CcmH/NrfG